MATFLTQEFDAQYCRLTDTHGALLKSTQWHLLMNIIKTLPFDGNHSYKTKNCLSKHAGVITNN